MGEAGQGGRWIGGERWPLQVVRCSEGEWGVVARGDHAFLREEAVQGVTEGREERRIQGPVGELRLPHTLQQVWEQESTKAFESRQLKA